MNYELKCAQYLEYAIFTQWKWHCQTVTVETDFKRFLLAPSLTNFSLLDSVHGAKSKAQSLFDPNLTGTFRKTNLLAKSSGHELELG